MNRVSYLVERSTDGCYRACAVAHGVLVEARSLSQLRQRLREVTCNVFGATAIPVLLVGGLRVDRPSDQADHNLAAHRLQNTASASCPSPPQLGQARPHA